MLLAETVKCKITEYNPDTSTGIAQEICDSEPRTFSFKRPDSSREAPISFQIGDILTAQVAQDKILCISFSFAENPHRLPI